MGKEQVIVDVRHMNKCFGSTIALNDVNIIAKRGEILGLIGENGSGKSTVTSIIAGMQKADSGEMLYKGEAWKPASVMDALEHGIGMIVQETGTVPGITVAENIFLGEANRFSRKGTGLGLVNRRKMMQEAEAILQSIHVSHIAAEAITGTLDLQDRKLIEIAKVMSRHPEVLIIDETTTALSQMGRDIIYKIINRMKEENKAVIFISHDFQFMILQENLIRKWSYI